MKLVYIFEDSASSPLSALLRSGCTKEISSVYADSCTNLHHKCREVLTDTDAFAVVFQDMCPGNEALFNVYRSLCALSDFYDNRLVVLPIVCAEFYYLASLYRSPVISDVHRVISCLLKEWEPFNSWCVQHISGKHTYESYCKWVVAKALLGCAALDPKHSSRSKVYFLFDCLCEHPTSLCTKLTLREKSLRFLRAFPIKPISFATMDSEDYFWKKLRELVVSYNVWLRNFHEASPGTIPHLTLTCIR